LPENTAPDRTAFPLPHILEPGEVLETHAVVDGVVIAATKHRLVIVDNEKTVLDIPFPELRRIQFDIERNRDATLVIVPEHISNWPRIISVPVAQLKETSETLAFIGERLNAAEEQKTGRARRV
jgi:hypothetical protein